MHGPRSIRPAAAAIAIALVTLLGACGGGDDADDQAAPAAPAATPDKTPTTTPGENTVVSVADTSLGSVLVDSEGSTLYAFLNDGPNVSKCNGPCAENWPPLVVDGDFQIGLNGAAFATAARTDGATQLTVGQHPLYRFAGDQAPGDTNGQGVNGKWFVVDSSGRLLDGSSAAFDVAAAPTALGDVLVDAQGNTLYAFVADTPGVSTCVDQCAQNWPPLAVDGSIRVGDGVTAVFGTTNRAEGSVQLTAAGRPLYSFSGDRAPGETNGQGLNGKWFVLDTAGNLVQATA